MIETAIRASRTWPRAVVAIFMLLAILAALLGWNVAGQLKSGGLVALGSESEQVRHRLWSHLGIAQPDAIVVVEPGGSDVLDAQFRQEISDRIADVARRPDVVELISFLDPAHPELVSTSKRRAALLLSLRGEGGDKVAALDSVRRSLQGSSYDLLFGGPLPAEAYAQETAIRDLGRAELIALPIAGLLLVVFFRGLLAAALPLLVAGFAIPAALGLIRLLVVWTDVSVFALNVASFLGLGLSIDYALVFVSRFREERGAGEGVDEAVSSTLRTSGQAILVSAIAVIGSLLVLTLFPLLIVRSIGLAGALVVTTAVLASTFLLPALLMLLGERLAPALPERAAAGGPWGRLARAVMQRPVITTVAVSTLLVAVGAPFADVRAVVPDARMFPAASEVRRVEQLLEAGADFANASAAPVLVAVGAPGGWIHDENLAAVHTLLAKLRTLDGVETVVSPFLMPPLNDLATARVALSDPTNAPPELLRAMKKTVAADETVIVLTGNSPWRSEAAQDLVARIRSLSGEPLVVTVGGATAEIVDADIALKSHLAGCVALIVLINLVVLFLAFGSVVIPIKAVAMNLVSLISSLGVLVWVFQEGHLAGLLDFEPPGGIDMTIPIVLFAIVFGLSMDYEVFLLSRIKEEFDRTGDNRQSVAIGLERTGSIITRAAVLLIVVVGAFAMGELIFVKELGVGMAVAIAIDATVVRLLLVPAMMQLLGPRNWWCPPRLRRIWKRIGFSVREGSVTG